MSWFNIRKIIWFLLQILAIIYFSYLHYTIHWDAAIGFIYLELLVTFPIGFIIPYIAYPITLILNDIDIKEYMFFGDIVMTGILFMIFGYIQWFIIIPKIKKYFKKGEKNDTN